MSNFKPNTNLIFFLALASYFVCCPNSSNGQTEKLDGVKHDDAVSMFESVLSNSFAWENGDVLLQVEKIADSSNNTKPEDNFSIKISKTYIRLIFDHTNSQYLCVKTTEFEQSIFSEDEVMVDQDSGRSVVAVLINKDGAFKKQLPNRMSRLKENRKATDHLVEAGFPDLRTTGIITFGRPAHLRMLEEKVSKIAGGGIVKSSISAGNDSQSVTLRFPSPKGGIKSETTYSFDARTFMPVRRSIYFLRKDEKNLNSSERFKWETRSGVHLPISVSREMKVGMRGKGGEMYLMDVELDAKMHWFSINEADSEINKLFSEDILVDEDRFLRLVDPVASKADTLIEDVGSEKND